MSISLMALAWKADMPSGRKLVLLALCDHANAQGECYPSVEAIARKCSMGQRTVQQHIGALEIAAILVRCFRKGRSTVYRLDPRNFCTRAEVAAPQDSTLQCATSVAPAPQPLHGSPAGSAPISIKEPSSNHQVVRGTLLSPTWTLPDAWLQWAVEAHPTWTAAHVQFVAEKFHDHWTAIPGQRGIKADWFAAWRNWCRNEKPVSQHHHAMQGQSWTGLDAFTANGQAGMATPLPGESYPTFLARVRRERKSGGMPQSGPTRTAPGKDAIVPAKSTISPANRAAALDAARALKSRLVRLEEKAHDFVHKCR